MGKFLTSNLTEPVLAPIAADPAIVPVGITILVFAVKKWMNK